MGAYDSQRAWLTHSWGEKGGEKSNGGGAGFSNQGFAPWRNYQQDFLAHDKGHAHADLPHGLQAHRDLLRPSTVVHKLVAQVAHDGLQPVGWDQVMARL